MIVTKSAGKLIQNNISMSESMKSGISRRVEQTIDQAGREVGRQAEQSVTDHDTSKVIRKTAQATAPAASVMSVIINKQIVKSTQAYADMISAKYGLSGTALTDAANKRGMGVKTFGDDSPRTEINAGMDVKVDLKDMSEYASYKNGARVVSTKSETMTVHFNNDGTGYLHIKHKQGVSENARFYREVSRSCSHDLRAMRRDSSTSIKDIKETERLRKGANKLARLGRQQEKALHKIGGSPKKLMRQFTRLGTSSLNESESMRGMQLARTLSMPIRTGAKMVTNAAIFAVGNIAVSGYRAVQMIKLMKSGKSFRDAWKMARSSDVIKHGLSGSFKNLIRNKIKRMIWGKNGLPSMFKEGSLLGNYFGAVGKIKTDNGMVQKKAMAEIRKAQRELVKNAFNKITPKPVKQAGKAVTGAMKEALMAMKKMIMQRMQKILGERAVHLLQSLLHALAQALSAMFQAIAAILGTIMTVAGWVIFFLIILAFIALCIDGKSAYDKQNAAIAIEESDGKAIMNKLKDKHKELEEDLKTNGLKNDTDQFPDIAYFDTVDIQYPNGSKENYKELFCAMQVEMEYNFDLVRNNRLKTMAEDLYDQTHLIVKEPYTFTYDDGTQGVACHIYVYIQRGEQLAYSIFEGQIPSDVYSNGDIVPVGECDATNWMDVVQTVKTLIAQTQVEYDQKLYLWIEVNGQKYRPRADCSGYVSTCLQVYKSLSGNSSAGTSTATMESWGSDALPGFVKLPWPGWDNLQQGDILVRRYQAVNSKNNQLDWYGHTEIFYANMDGQHLVYSNGSSNGLQSAYPRNDSVKAYDTVWRPVNPGSVTEEAGDNINAVTGEGRDYILREWNRSFGENAFILASNQSDIEFEPETGNEAGYDSAILATIEAVKTMNGVIDSGTKYDGYGTMNFVAKDGKFDRASSLDFIRYICAQHGVSADYSLKDMVTNCYTTTNDTFSDKAQGYELDEDAPSLQTPHCLDSGPDDVGNLQVGDIMLYVPEDESWENDYNDKNFNEWTLGTSKFFYAVSKSYPMMYVGDGNFVYYMGGVHANNAGNGNKIVTVNIADLEQNRCLNKCVIRYIGFTVEPVYGATPSFCGWTDYKIGELIVLMNGSQWVDKEVNLSSFGMTKEQSSEAIEVAGEEDVADWNETEEDAEEGAVSINPYSSEVVSYSFYEEDICTETADYYKPSLGHIDKLIEEISKVSIMYYDMYGILPSTAICQMGAASHFRSTEESLLYFNIFELTSPTGEGVQKYTYNAEGDASTAIHNYKRYSSYLEAYSDWSAYARSHGYPITSDYAKSFETQKNSYVFYGVIPSSLGSDMTTIYNDYSTRLDSADAAAVERKKAIDDVVNLTNHLNNTSLPTTKPTMEDYYEYCALMNDLTEAVKYLNNNLSLLHTATERTDIVFQNAIDAWRKANEIRKSAYQYYQNHEWEYVESWTCPGHSVEVPTTITIKVPGLHYDPALGKVVEIVTEMEVPSTKTEIHYCDTDILGTDAEIRSRCPNAAIHHQEWGEFGNQSRLSEPTYDQISANNTTK